MSKPFYTNVTRGRGRQGDYLYFRGYNNSKRIQRKVRYKPTLYVPSPEPTEFKSLSGSYLADMTFESIREARNFIDEYKNVDNFDIHGNQDFIQQFISDAFQHVIEFNRDVINVTTIDIEVQSDQGFPRPEDANHPVTAITIKNNIDNVYYVWGMGDWDHSKSIVNHLTVKYVKCANEAELLHKFMDQWASNYPDAVTGWNSRFFDLVYLVNRINKVLGDGHANKLSPWHHEMGHTLRYREVGSFETPVYEIEGIEQLDYLDLFKKFAYSYGTQESYKLDHIAHVVLGENKIDYSEYGSLNELYLNDFQKFIDYNIKDVEIVDRLEDKMGLATLCMTIAYKGKVNYADAFGSVAVWDALIFNELRSRGIICPPKRSNEKERKIEGAHVKDPQVGMHEWVMSFDLNSLYPHIIMQYNMSPETIVDSVHSFDLLKRDNTNGHYHSSVDYLLDQNPLNIKTEHSMAGTGQFFDRTKRGLFPELVDNLYSERKQYKKQMLDVEQQIQDQGSNYELEKLVTTLDNKQMAIKILMNSLYGAMSNEYFRYYDMRIAEGITISGQLTIRWAEKHLNQYMNKVLGTDNQDYVIAIDTDSLYINMGGLVNKVNPKDPVKFLDKVATEKIEPLLDLAYQKLKDYLHGYDQMMVMKREVIASKGVWTGKKHYVLNVHNSEGVQYKEPKLKMMGIEAVRSSTPAVCREMFKDTLKVILEKDEISTQNYIRELRDKFKHLPIEDIAFPRSVNRLPFYKDSVTLFKKGTPIQVRAALKYNYYIDQYQLNNKYEKIYSGEKIKFCYLKQPNKVQSNVIAFPQILPEEFSVREHVDYDTQFEKAFVEPVKSILDAVGWDVEPRATLEAFF
jgi:DNA polymerase elongation subunit (family B)